MSGVKKARVKQKPVKTVESVTTEKEHVNIVFIGHVDAGKSTIGGQLMYLTNMVDKRTLEKYEKEAKEKNRETWYLSWCMDTNQEERDKGKTVEVCMSNLKYNYYLSIMTISRLAEHILRQKRSISRS